MLKMSNVSFSYTGKEILHYKDFIFTPGCTLISGPSGSGKSTLFSLISKTVRPLTGTISWNEIDIHDYKNNFYLKDILSIVLQSAALSYYFTLADYIYIIKLQNENYLKNYKDYLEFLELMPLLDKNINDCSGGEQYKIAFFISLCKNTPLFLLDEPTAHLDKINSLKIINIIKARPEIVHIIISHELFFFNDSFFSHYSL